MSARTDKAFQFSLSAKQQEAVDSVIERVCEAVEAVGTSRFDAKQEAYAGGCKGSHAVNQRIGITSYASIVKFTSTTRTFLSFCFDGRTRFPDVHQVKPEHCRQFLSEAMGRGYAKNSLQSFASGLEKLAMALDKALPLRGQSWSTQWHPVISDCQGLINEKGIARDVDTRAYDNPVAIIEALPSAKLQAVAMLQLYHGLRIADATKISRVAGDGTMLVHNSKNGQDLTIHVKPEVLDVIRQASNGGMNLTVRQSDYNKALRVACEATGQGWQGSHGLRHCFARNRMGELLQGGMSYTRALAQVSDELGHHRPSITLTYLR